MLLPNQDPSVCMHYACARAAFLQGGFSALYGAVETDDCNITSEHIHSIRGGGRGVMDGVHAHLKKHLMDFTTIYCAFCFHHSTWVSSPGTSTAVLVREGSTITNVMIIQKRQHQIQASVKTKTTVGPL